MRKLQKHGNGIVLMHDFQHGTAEALSSRQPASALGVSANNT
jgi:hypothetical protein